MTPGIFAMIHSPKRKYFLITIAVLLALVLAATIFLPYLVDINNYRGFIVKKAEELLNRRVSIEKIQLHLINGIGIRCTGVIIWDAGGREEFISARDMLLKFKPIPLLRKELVINKIIFDYPRINIERDSRGKFSFQLPEAPPEKKKGEKEKGIEWSLSRLLIDKIIIRQGRARLMDRTVGKRGLLMQLEELDLTLKEFELGRPFALTLTAKLDLGENKVGHIALSAKVAGLGKDRIDPARIRLDAQAKLTNWNLAAFSSYYRNHLPWNKLTGLADIELDYQGNLADEFRLKAEVDVKSVVLTCPKLFTAPLPFPTARARVDAVLKDRRLDLQIKSFKLACVRFNISGRLQLANLLSPQRSISLQAVCSPFTIVDGKRYIPFKAIPPKAADFINNCVSSGVVEDLSVKLAGELGRFKELNKPQNHGLLSAAAKFKGFKLMPADQAYKLEDISGSAELGEGKLVVDELSARIEDSRLRIYNSRITDLYTAPRFELHSTAELSLADGYLSQKLPAELKQRLAPRGTANLRLEARGDSQKLALAGSLDLNRVSYSYGSWLKKKAGQSNSVEFEGQLLNRKSVELRRLVYHLGNSRLLINVVRLNPLQIDLQAGRFDIQDLKPIMPNLFTPQTKGFVSADVKVSRTGKGTRISGQMSIKDSELQLVKYSPKLEGEGRLRFNLATKPEGLGLEGRAELTRAAYSYKDKLRKPAGLKNTVVLQGVLKDTGELQLDKLLIRLDSSEANLTGRIKDFESTRAELKLSGKEIKVSHLLPVFGDLLPDKLNITGGSLNLALGLTGPLNDPSRLDIQGDIQLYNAIISGEDPFYRLDNLNAHLTPLRDSSLRLTLQAEQGNYQKFGFSRLLGQIKLKKSQMLINRLSLEAYQGSLSLKGKLDIPPTPPRYDLSFKVKNMDIRQLLQSLGLADGIISGRITANGQLSSTGKGKNKFAGLNGVVKLKLTDGEIKKYGTLAKIFSLISPTVLLNGELPDLNRQGFPYQSIQGSFNIANGVATTEDLTLASDAWRIVTLGRIDLTNRQLDLKVYVQPWQTLDKLVSKIPIAGKILKGEKRGMIDTYFTVKGDFDSPEVTAKPLTSLAENIWGIFKRTLKLPLTIFSK
jgi:uncharacterized protein involved in outer membrane biogenesis